MTMLTMPTVTVTCRVLHCRDTILQRDVRGQWVSRHHARTMRFTIQSGTMMLDLECSHNHQTQLLIDSEGSASVI